MLDKQVIKIEERLVEHKLFLPQVVQHEVWIRGLHKRHNCRRQSPLIEM
jgi:hypothetical protein